MPDNDVRMRVLLLAMVFCPYAGTFRAEGGLRAFHARDFKKAAPHVFSKIWTSPKMAGKQIATTVRMLAHRGYLVEMGRRKATWFNPLASTEEASEIHYLSPAYALTETGLSWALSNCDLRILPKLTHPRPDVDRRWPTLKDLGADFLSHEMNKRFINFTKIQKWLDNPGWGESRYEFPGAKHGDVSKEELF